MKEVKCKCGCVIATHNANRGMTECHDCLDKRRESNAMATEFLKTMFESDVDGDVDKFIKALKEREAVRAWAVKLFNDTLIERGKDDEVHG